MDRSAGRASLDTQERGQYSVLTEKEIIAAKQTDSRLGKMSKGNLSQNKQSRSNISGGTEVLKQSHNFVGKQDYESNNYGNQNIFKAATRDRNDTSPMRYSSNPELQQARNSVQIAEARAELFE